MRGVYLPAVRWAPTQLVSGGGGDGQQAGVAKRTLFCLFATVHVAKHLEGLQTCLEHRHAAEEAETMLLFSWPVELGNQPDAAVVMHFVTWCK